MWSELDENSIPSFAEAIESLQSVLKSCQKESGSAKGTRLKKIPLEWTDQMNKAFENFKKLIENAVRLAHPDFEKQFFSVHRRLRSSLGSCTNSSNVD